MGTKRTDISQIRKYFDGELDAAAMHKLEREAQDDPFLMDALEGYEVNPSQQYPANDLDDLLQQRIAKQRQAKIIPWRYYAAAASILLFVILGYEIWTGRQQLTQSKLTASNLPAPVDHAVIKRDTTAGNANAKSTLAATNAPLQKNVPIRPEVKPATAPLHAIAANALTTYKADTVAYRANDYKVDKSVKIEDLLKKMEDNQVAADGSVTSQGQAVAKVKLNGKDYTGGDVKQAVRNLPADVVEKAQLIDDYGDQAARAGLKGKKDSLVLKEVTVAGYAKLTKKDIDAGSNNASQTLLGKVSGANVTTPPKISGTVYDQLGSALAGVAVLMNGTQNSTVTDEKGRFSLPARSENTLNLNYIGFESARIKADANDSLQIKLKPTNASLNEVVVTRPYTNTKKIITAARPRAGWDDYNKYLKTMAVTDVAGTVNLSFTVNAQGQLSNFRIIKGINDTMNQQAITLLKKGPPWDGDSSGLTVTVKLKIHFSKK